MFVRTLTVRRGQRTYRYLKLVENHTVNGHTVQKTLVNLGNADRWTDERLQQAVATLSSFVGLPWSRLEQVRVGQPRQLGTYLALGQLWDELGMDDIIGRALAGREMEIPVAQYVRAMVFHRLVDPCSKLALHRSMAERMLVPGLDPSDLPLHGYYRSLDYLASVGTGRRTIAIIGDMGELGEASREYHREIGRRVAELGIDCLFAVGEEAAGYIEGARESGGCRECCYHFEDRQAALDAIPDMVRKGDVALVKASRFIKLEELSEALAGQAES